MTRPSPLRAILFDVDGTLCDPSHRLHHLDGERDWNAFFAAQLDDPPVAPIVDLARIMYRAAEAGIGFDAVIIVTARPARPDWQSDTMDWLALQDVPHHRIYFRDEGDTRPDEMVKATLLERILADGYLPVLVVDDRPQVVRMWRDHGITTLQCAPDEPVSSPYAGQTLLHMLVGPSGAGKSTYASRNYRPQDVVSTDALRIELYGDLGHSPDALKRVWRYAHSLMRARLDNGVLTVLDATNLEQEDRLRVLSVLPRGVFARYVVIDRDLRDKERDRGWRPEDLIMKHHKLFRSEERNILSGDEHPWVTVQDRRDGRPAHGYKSASPRA